MSCAASRRVVSFVLLAAVLACGTIDAAEQWTLTVDSTLPRGVPITGTHAGTTDYEALLLDDGTAVSLTAPGTSDANGIHFTFVEWRVDGVSQGASDTVGFNIGADTSVVAYYDAGATFGAAQPSATVEHGPGTPTFVFDVQVTNAYNLEMWGFWIENPTSGPTIDSIAIHPDWPFGGAAWDHTTHWIVLGDAIAITEPPEVLNGNLTLAQVTIDYTGAAPNVYDFTFPHTRAYVGTPEEMQELPALVSTDPVEETNPVNIEIAAANLTNFELTVNAAEPPTPDPMTWAAAPHLTDPNDPNSSITMTATQATDNTTLPDDITYEVRVDGALILGPQVEETFVHDLTSPGPNEPHTYEVRAIDEAGNSTAFSTPADTVYTPANPPINGAVVSVDASSIEISWEANGNPVEPAANAVRYEVQVFDDAGFTDPPDSTAGPTTDLTAVLGGLNPDTDYWIRVRALNGNDVVSAWHELGVNPVHTLLDNPPSHDADYRGGAANWHIDIFEVLRITTLYNSGGEYHVDPAEADGFAAGTGSHDPRGHDGDYRPTLTKNWKIDIFEVLRITTLYNSGGEYHVDGSTDDGFAAGTGPHAPGPPAPAGEPTGDEPPPPLATVTVTRTHGPSYTAGGTFDITIAVEYDEPLDGLAFEETLPSGWTFVSVTSSGQFFVSPIANQASPLGFLYSSALGKPAPASPFSFTYTVNVPAGQTDVVTLAGSAEYVQGGGNIPVPVADTTADEAAVGEWTLRILPADAGGTTDPVPADYVVPAGGSTDVASAPDPARMLDFWELDGQDVGNADPISVGPFPDQDLHTLKPVFKPVVVATRSHSPKYPPDGTFDITIDVEYHQPLDGLAFEETIPAGWTFVSVTDPGQFFVAPILNQSSPLGFLYNSALGKPVPASPFSFTYTVRVPAAQAGVVTFRGEWEYTQGGGGNIPGTTPATQADADITPPLITNINPDSGPPFTQGRITGTDFGTTPGQVVYTPPGGGPLSWDVLPGTWTDTSIGFRVPTGTPVHASPGMVKVVLPGGTPESNEVAFTVTNPTLILVNPANASGAENGTAGKEFNTIREAMTAADIGDTVECADGEYKGDGTWPGEGNRDLDFEGKRITVESANGAGACTIDCQGSAADPHRAFLFENNETSASVVDGFTIQGGYNVGDGGGAIVIDYLTPSADGPTISNNRFTDNTAASSNAHGGAIRILNASPTISGNEFDQNRATSSDEHAFGGAIYCADSAPTISGNEFVQNTAESQEASGDAYGGAIYSTATAPSIAGNRFVQNTASGVRYGYGGAVYVGGGGAGGPLEVTSNSFDGNAAVSTGTSGNVVASAGALYVGRECLIEGNEFVGNSSRLDTSVVDRVAAGGAMTVYFAGTATISGNRIVGNTCDAGAASGTAAYGGGIACISGDLTTILTNNVIAGNRVSAAGQIAAADGARGGGVRVWGGVATLTNNTIANNEAIAVGSGTSAGGGLYCGWWTAAANTTLKNSIVWGNRTQAGPDQLAKDTQSILAVSYSDVQGGYAGTGNINQDPVFFDPDGPDNTPGTADDDYHLQSLTGRWNGTAFVPDSVHSPCIDMGEPGPVGAEVPPNGGIINAGAYGGTAEASLSAATITVLADPADQSLEVAIGGVAGVAPQMAELAEGAQVEISAPTLQTGADGKDYRFTGWSDGNTDNPRTVTVNGQMEFTAEFVKQIEITFLTDPTGLDILYDNVTYTTPIAFTVDAGSDHLINAPLDQQGIAGERFSFLGWAHGGAQEQSVSPMDDITYTAQYKTEYLLDLRVNPSAPSPGGTATITNPTGFFPWFPEDTVVTIEAAVAAGFQFVGWSSGGILFSTDVTIQVTMVGPKEVTAEFVAERQVTIQTAVPTDLMVRIDDGAAQPAPVVIDTLEGASHKVEAVTPQGDAGTEHRFGQWDGGGSPTNPILNLTVIGDATYTASFNTFHALTLIEDGPGSVAANPAPEGGKWIADGITVTLTATADPNGRFTGWSGDATGTVSPTTIDMDGPKTVTGHFVEQVGIEVTSNPTGIQFMLQGGGQFTTPHTFTVDKDSALAVEMPDEVGAGQPTKQKFAGWQDLLPGGGIPTRALPTGQDGSFTANYDNWHQLLTEGLPPAGGTVGVDPDSADPPYYKHGDQVTLTPEPSGAGWQFTNWSGDAGGTTPSLPVTMDAAKSIAANFQITQWTLNVTSSPITGVPISGTHPGITGTADYPVSVSHGTEVSLSAPATVGTHNFVRWDRDGQPSVFNTTILITVGSNENVAAVYEEEANPAITISKTPDLQQILSGETATFTITVTNTGDVDLTNVAVSDPLCPDCDRVIGDLAVGATEEYDGQRLAVTEDFTNEAIVTAQTPSGGEIEARDTADVDVIGPSIKLTKTPALQQILEGGTATFNIEIENTGDVTLSNTAVTDDECPDCARAAGSLPDLAPGEKTSYSGQRTNVAADFTNVAVVTADTPIGGQVTDTGSSEVDVIHPAITIAKATSTPVILSGQDAQFTVDITNTGDVALSTVQIADPNCTDCEATFATLGVGETQQTTGTVANVTADLTNEATVTASAPAGPDLQASDTAGVDVIHPAITIVKTTSTPVILSGQDAQFTVDITNTGDVPLTTVQIADPNCTDCEATFATLGVGETRQTTGTVANVTADLANEATVTASAPAGPDLQASDTADVDVIHPAIAITKTTSTPIILSGQDAQFEVVIENTGDVPLSNVVVTDPECTDCQGTFTTLAVGETQTLPGTVAGLTADLLNEATVTADAPVGPALSQSDTASVDVIHPAIEITKTALTPQIRQGGDAVFEIAVSNTGDVVLTNVEVTDPNCAACSRTIGALAVGQTVPYQGTESGVQADFTNTATVTADAPVGPQLTDSDSADIDVVNPAITITKTPDDQQVRAGGAAAFTVTVTNTGDVELTNVRITDPECTDCEATFATLGVGASEQAQGTVTNVQADFINTATVAATAPGGPDLIVSDAANVDVIRPAISISKTPDLSTILAGSDVTFTVTITNTGDVPLTNARITDPNCTDCEATFATLGVGASEQTQGTVTNIQADLTNTATVTATAPAGPDLQASDDAVVDVVHPAITISKTPDTQTINAGEDATFTIIVTNTGDVDLTNLLVTDPLCPACDRVISSLAAGESVSYDGTTPAPADDFTNVAFVTATAPVGPDLAAADDAFVDVLHTPAPATNLTHTAVTTTSITWSWTDNSNNEDGFHVQDENGATLNTVGPGVTTWTETGLAVNTAYTRQVVAYNATGEAAPSNQHTACTAIETPTAVSFPGVTNTTIDLMAEGGPFSNLATPDSGILFEETGGSNGGINQWVPAATDQATGLDPNTPYEFRAKARNCTQHETAYTPTATKYTLATQPGAAGYSNIGTNGFTANWTAGIPANPAGTDYFAACTVELVGTPAGDNGWAAETSHDFTGLTPNTRYTCDVKARNGEGAETNDTSLGSAVTLAAVPTNGRFDQINATNIEVAWDANGNPNGTQYRLRVLTPDANGTEVDDTGWITERNVDITGLTPNTPYCFEVRARNSAGEETAIHSFGSGSVYTKAAVPGLLLVDMQVFIGLPLNPNAPAARTLGILSIAPNGNPAGTDIAIKIGDELNSGWLRQVILPGGIIDLRADGTAPEYHTAAFWANKRHRWLTPDTLYEYKAQARNGLGEVTPLTDVGEYRTNVDGDVNRSGTTTAIDYTYARTDILNGGELIGGTPAPVLPQSFANDNNDDRRVNVIDLTWLRWLILNPQP